MNIGVRFSISVFVSALISLSPLHGQEKNARESRKLVTAKERNSQHLLPADACLWLSIPDASTLKNDFNATGFGTLAQRTSIKKFLSNFRPLIEKWAGPKNVLTGISIDELFTIAKGEICVAAVKDGDEPGYGVMLMMELGDDHKPAKRLLEKIRRQLELQGVARDEIKVAGQPVSRWSFWKIKKRPQRFVYHTITDRWLILCDRRHLLKDTISRIDHSATTASLGATGVFQKSRAQCALQEDTKPQIQWFVEPFGFLDMLGQFAEQDVEPAYRSTNYVRLFKESGFAAIKGVAGNILINERHQFVYRTYWYAPKNAPGPFRKYTGAAEMLRFENKNNISFMPEPFVAEKSSSYVSFTWDLVKVLDHLKPLFDAWLGENSYDAVFREIRDEPTGPRVDMRKFFQKFDDRITVFTENTHPIDENAEKIVIAVKVKQDFDEVFDICRRIINPPQNKVIKFAGTTILIDEYDEDLEIDIDILEIDGGEDPMDEDEEPEPLFEQRVYAIHDGYLLFSNNLEYLKKLIVSAKNKPGLKLEKSSEFVRVNRELSKYVDPKRVSLRQFVRLDESFRVNYEMLQQGKMVTSNSIVASFLNLLLSPMEGNKNRVQKIDGSVLPKDFVQQIAPFLGVAGFAMETQENGWLISGVILPGDGRIDPNDLRVDPSANLRVDPSTCCPTQNPSRCFRVPFCGRRPVRLFARPWLRRGWFRY